MTDEPIEVVRGSGNLFRDFGYPDAALRHAKALMCAQIIRTLDRESLSTRQAQARTGVSHSDFSRLRNADLRRFTLDRLMTILALLGQEVEVSVSVHPRQPRQASAHP